MSAAAPSDGAQHGAGGRPDGTPGRPGRAVSDDLRPLAGPGAAAATPPPSDPEVEDERWPVEIGADGQVRLSPGPGCRFPTRDQLHAAYAEGLVTGKLGASSTGHRAFLFTGGPWNGAFEVREAGDVTSHCVPAGDGEAEWAPAGRWPATERRYVPEPDDPPGPVWMRWRRP